jgi:hypothetical protein
LAKGNNEKDLLARTRHFSGREVPWHFRGDSVGGDSYAVAPAEFYVMSQKRGYFFGNKMHINPNIIFTNGAVALFFAIKYKFWNG